MEYFALGYYLAHALARLPNSQHYEAERNGGWGLPWMSALGPEADIMGVEYSEVG